MGRRGVSSLEDRDCLASCMQMTWFYVVGWFAEVYRSGLKFNAGNIKMILLKGEEGLDCEIHVDGIHLEHISEFKYLGCVLDESGTDGAECSRKLANGRRVADAIKSLLKC